MNANNDRSELLRRLEQSRRLAAGTSDALTKELRLLVQDREEQLRRSEQGPTT